MKTILLVTYDISPYRGSEASVGWNYVSNMQHTNRLIVLYGKGQTEIESYLRTNTMPHVRFQNIAYTEIDGHGLINDIKYNLNYRKWHKRVTDAATKILAEEPVDVIHYLNPIGFKEPGFLWQLPRPYVWGPIQGVENRPTALFRALSAKGKINAIIRRIVHNAMFVLSPRVRLAIKRSDYIFAATPNTKKNLWKYYHKESLYMPENGIMSMIARSPIIKTDRDPLRLIWVGDIGERKALIIFTGCTEESFPDRLGVAYRRRWSSAPQNSRNCSKLRYRHPNQMAWENPQRPGAGTFRPSASAYYHVIRRSYHNGIVGSNGQRHSHIIVGSLRNEWGYLRGMRNKNSDTLL